MTRVRIDPGICGLCSTVTVKSKGRRIYEVSVKSECEMIRKLGNRISELSMMDAFTRTLENPVYRSAAACLKHVSCPVPSGLLKALEVEAGLALPKDVCMHFQPPDEEEEGSAPAGESGSREVR